MLDEKYLEDLSVYQLFYAKESELTIRKIYEIEGDVFRTIVPLNDVSIGVVGPKDNSAATDATTDATLTREQLMQKIIEFCVIPHSRDELMQKCGLVNKNNFMKSYIKPLLEENKIKMTIPDKPSSKNQKYVKS
ncbi:MAG: hypothetical protein Q4C49_14290 [Bacillota bacterium]|nr:hypothetical protein [Bacillota bacterium]